MSIYVPNAVSVGFINIALMGLVCARYSKNPVNQARWFWLFFAIGITTTFYGFVIPRCGHRASDIWFLQLHSNRDAPLLTSGYIGL